MFKSIKVGRPIFYYQGIEGLPQDYSLFIESIKSIIERRSSSYDGPWHSSSI